ncbi:MAG TPA: dienelactone hydrolase family protein [Baekduia sp.]|nr:dienelactone hydrolase family protein [Baekduia sp.]
MTESDVHDSEDRRLGDLRIHIAHPAAKSDAGVLLYPTIMGLDDAMRSLARELANEGMTAVVWDPYDGVDGTGVMPDMLARSKQREDHGVVRDLKSIVDHMQDELGLVSIAGIGWCFGGRIGILHAGSDDRVGALASYNPTIWSVGGIDIGGANVSRSDFPGQTMDEFALAANIRGPVQVSRPEYDFTTSAEYQRLVDVLCTRRHPTFYEFYPEAGHGFSYSPGEANARAHRFAWGATLSMFALAASADQTTA